ncbi:hypothetical protein FRB96_007473 [Tulasnella sp. 330]|nr:hypothetical protein FRB96_007473 [Tulasnella sp. 330]KAG8883400.1 hypothetical protein FRB97_006682 [Tulasnella sp. 331]
MSTNLAASTHIGRLSFEELSAIFVHYAKDESNPLVLPLGDVCHFWRDVLLNTPSVWKHVKIAPERKTSKLGFIPLEKVPDWVARAGTCPLTVTLDLVFDPKEEVDSPQVGQGEGGDDGEDEDEDETDETEQAEEPNCERLEFAAKVFAFLADHPPQHLLVRNPHDDVSTEKLLDLCVEPHLNNNTLLKSLSLDLPNHTHSGPYLSKATSLRFREAISSSTSLQSLDVPGPLAPHVHPSTIQRLRYLCINQPPSYLEGKPKIITFENFNDISTNEESYSLSGAFISLSANASVLTSLKLGQDLRHGGLAATPEFLPRVTLPRLDDLHIANWSDLEILLYKLHTPNLRHLRLSSVHGRTDASAGLMSFVACHEHSPKLQTLFLGDGIGCHQRSLLWALEQLPTLLELRIPSTNLTKAFVNGFTRPLSVEKGWLCPNLEMLNLARVDAPGRASDLMLEDFKELIRVRVLDVPAKRSGECRDQADEGALPFKFYGVAWEGRDMIKEFCKKSSFQARDILAKGELVE